MTEPSVPALLTEPTTVTLTPAYEGANIGTIIGFKHVNYLVEKAVIEHFRRAGLPVGRLYERYGLGFDIIDQSARLQTALVVDDEATVDVRPVTGSGARELAFQVTITVERDGVPKKAVTAKVAAVLRSDGDEVRMPRRAPVPAGLDRFVVERIGGAQRGAPAPAVGERLVSGGSTERSPVLKQLLADRNGYAWKFRIPYPYVHFFERMPISGYLRLVEEAKHRFVDARGISIGRLLAEQNWIPAVTQSQVRILDEALIEEDLYIVYVVDSIFKNLLYTARVDFYVVRGERLLRSATGTITHGYGIVENGSEGRLVEWDERVACALRGEPAVTS